MPSGFGASVEATATLTRYNLLVPEGSAASVPNAQQRRGPHRFLKPHLLVQIICPFFSRNLKARLAILKLNGTWVLDCPRRSRSLRSATWAGPVAEAPLGWMRAQRSGPAAGERGGGGGRRGRGGRGRWGNVPWTRELGGPEWVEGYQLLPS